MSEAPTQPQPLGAEGELCEACAAPLAADQRYCLNCGTRRAGPRVDYTAYMTGAGGDPAASPDNGSQPPPAGAGTPSPDGPAGPEKKERDYGPLAAVGGIAVLGLVLLVGVLIGKGDSGGTTTTAAPPVVHVTRGEEEVPIGGSGESGGSSGAAKGAGAAKPGAKKKAPAAATAAAPPPSSASDLESLNEQSGSSYEQESKNLPNEIATPGAPPPVDKSKAPGGGEGGGVTIK